MCALGLKRICGSDTVRLWTRTKIQLSTEIKRVVTLPVRWRARQAFQRGIGNFVSEEIFLIPVVHRVIHGSVPLLVLCPKSRTKRVLLIVKWVTKSCPLYPRKRTFPAVSSVSAKGQK